MTLGKSRRKAICSIGVGPHAELLEIARPGFERYAARHGYEVVLEHRHLAPERPVAWSKVRLLAELVASFDLVMWVDADAVIVDAAVDLADQLRPGRMLHLVAHEIEGRPVPNSGVLALRGGRSAARLLERVWAAERYIEHKWWENAALIELLGYSVEEPVVRQRTTLLKLRTQFIDPGWNTIPQAPQPAHPRIRHYPGFDQATRVSRMLEDAATAT
jgi:hypothetical protein